MATSVVQFAAAHIYTGDTVAVVTGGAWSTHPRTLRVYALYPGRCAAASVVYQTLVNVGAVVAISGVTTRTCVAEECTRSVLTIYPRVHRTWPMVTRAFVNVLGAGGTGGFGLPTLIANASVAIPRAWFADANAMSTQCLRVLRVAD